MKLLLHSLLLSLVFFALNAFSQINITANGLTSWVDYKITIEADTSGMVPVDVGSAGGNQMWDFSNFTNPGFIVEQEMKTAASTPYSGQYPGANYAYITRFPEFPQYGSIYNYINISDSGVESVGDVIVAEGTIIESQDQSEITPLPLTYGSSWTTTSADTFVVPGVGFSITTATETITIDAWGTIKLPSGEFECLRWKSKVAVEQSTVIDGMEFPISSFEYIDYQWIGENSFFLASASSPEGNTDPNFSTAADVSWLAEVSASTGVLAQEQSTPRDFQVFKNYPNPFNPSTRISFQLSQSDAVQVHIYDVNGRLVRTLVSQTLSAGTHEFAWNATDDAGQAVSGGTYFYEVTAGESRSVGKMTFLK